MWRRAPEMMKVPVKTIFKILDINFISIKKHEMEISKSYKLFYFQVRESPAPRNIPTPTPAPDRGGPVAGWRLNDQPWVID